MRLRAPVTKRLLDIEEFRSQAIANRKPGAGVYTTHAAAPQQIAARTLRFCFSEGSVDRMSDTISQLGWDLSWYRRNPVIQWAHDTSQPPIGRAPNVWVENGRRLMGDIEFAPSSINPFAETIFQMCAGGWLNACSVGFRPTSWQLSKDPDRPGGIDFISQQLLECSIVPVPALQSALIEGRAKGINVAPLASWAAKQGSAQRSFRQSAPPDDPAARLARVRRVAELQRSTAGLATIRLSDDRTRDAFISPTQAKEQAALLRARHGLKQIDPRVVAAQAAFRMGRI
jgi:phage head maturation protease